MRRIVRGTVSTTAAGRSLTALTYRTGLCGDQCCGRSCVPFRPSDLTLIGPFSSSLFFFFCSSLNCHVGGLLPLSRDAVPVYRTRQSDITRKGISERIDNLSAFKVIEEPIDGQPPSPNLLGYFAIACNLLHGDSYFFRRSRMPTVPPRSPSKPRTAPNPVLRIRVSKNLRSITIES